MTIILDQYAENTSNQLAILMNIDDKKSKSDLKSYFINCIDIMWEISSSSNCEDDADLYKFYEHMLQAQGGAFYRPSYQTDILSKLAVPILERRGNNAAEICDTLDKAMRQAYTCGYQSKSHTP